MSVLLVALGAAVGAPLRYVAGHLLDRRLPWGTLLVNVVGSFLLGAFSAAALSASTLALLGAGFSGGLTTYSAFAVQAHDRGPRVGGVYVVLTLGLCLGACWLGFVLFGQPA
ncbi:MAG TPA: CrcB family protein [Nocardioidaceae bacterium]|nr:CrcB family protein [Nocardioidaceae bacterium]